MNNIPYGYCHCGCGQKTSLAPRNNASINWIKGKPLLSLRGHKAHTVRPLMTAGEHRNWWFEHADSISYGYCWCGCGRRTNIADSNKPKHGHFKGMPMRFRAGHQNRDKPYPEQRYSVEDRGYKTPCWIWQLRLDKDGYGATVKEGRSIKAYRLFYEEYRGTIPEGFQLDHLCRVRACVNPMHLEIVTPAENVRRSSRTKLTPVQIEQIRNLHATGEFKQVDLARQYGVNPSTISLLLSGRTWK